MVEVYTRARDLKSAATFDDRCPHEQLARMVIQQAVKDLRSQHREEAIDFLLGIGPHKEAHNLWFGAYLGRQSPDSLADIQRGEAFFFEDSRHSHAPRKTPETDAAVKARIEDLKLVLSEVSDPDVRHKLQVSIETQRAKLRRRKRERNIKARAEKRG